MSDFAAGQVFLFAGAMFAASLALMALGWVGGLAKRASLRHLAWAAAFAALIALPVLAMAVPGAVVLKVPAPQAVPPTDGPATMDVPAASVAPPEDFHIAPGGIAMILAALWLAGVVLIALRHLLAALLLYRLRRDGDAHPFDDSELPASAGRYELRLSRGARGPLTWGVLRPVILLPNAAQVWPHERLQAVLRHEFAHVRRRDGLCQLLACTACALYWPSPFVWLGARAMRREAEIAADDAVIASGMTPSDYAGELLEMAREFRSGGLTAALAMAAPSALPARVKSILAPTLSRSGVTFMDVLKMAAIALLATGALVAARPSFAQDAPPVPPPPAAEATPAAPAAPAMDATMPAPPTPPAEVAGPPTPPTPPAAAEPVIRIVRVHDTHHGHELKRVREEIVLTDRDVKDAMARVKPQIEAAMAEVRAHAAEIRRIELERPRIAAEIKSALAEARAQVALIKDDAIRAKADAALARAQARLDAAGEDRTERRTIIMKDGGADDSDNNR